ncbi:ATP-binding protein [Actinophytocola oryzae]|uniref:Histidine kinase-like protein n=1 Tax=Actinophytocola oryzae TaxID=502181 RepID=A0A4R7VFY1_9PSEU|nr:ATP-binding protein [Actinophytocola oryzae]TDV47948.1 histidine kinase-like protein [Actinophytocola oryzae]
MTNRLSCPVGSHSLDLRGSDARGLRRLRQWLSAVLADLGERHVTEVMQVADELASNAYEHGDGPQMVRLHHCVVDGRTTIEVEDSNLETVTVGQSRFGEAAHRGRGLVLVQNIARAWGVRRRAGTGRKTVWAVLACQAEPRADGQVGAMAVS